MPNYNTNWTTPYYGVPYSYTPMATDPSYASNQNYRPVQNQQSQSGSGIVYINGIEAANEYPVAAGTSVLLMDGNLNRFYIKSNDSMGINKQLRVFDYKEVGNIQNESKTNDGTFETDSLKAEVKELKELVNMLLDESGGGKNAK